MFPAPHAQGCAARTAELAGIQVDRDLERTLPHLADVDSGPSSRTERTCWSQMQNRAVHWPYCLREEQRQQQQR